MQIESNKKLIILTLKQSFCTTRMLVSLHYDLLAIKTLILYPFSPYIPVPAHYCPGKKKDSDLPQEHLCYERLPSFLCNTKAWRPNEGNCRVQNASALATALSIWRLQGKKIVATLLEANILVAFNATRTKVWKQEGEV